MARRPQSGFARPGTARAAGTRVEITSPTLPDFATVVRVARPETPTTSGQSAEEMCVFATDEPSNTVAKRLVIKDDVLSLAGQLIPGSVEGGGGESEYEFDAVLQWKDEQSVFYRSVVQHVVEQTLQGYHGSIIAIGPRHTGKAYSMRGPDPITEEHGPRVRLNRGAILRAAEQVLHCLQVSRGAARGLVVVVSYVWISNEEIYDLLSANDLEPSADAPSSKQSSSCQRIALDDDGQLEGLSEHVVSTASEVEHLLHRGIAQDKQLCAEQLNQRSRHVIFTITVEHRGGMGSDFAPISGVLRMVELADWTEAVANKAACHGNESQRIGSASSGTMDSQFDKSLVEFIRTLHIAAEQDEEEDAGTAAAAVNESVLLKLLPGCIGGNSKTVLVWNVCPSSQYAQISKKIVSTAATLSKSIRNKPNKRDLAEQALMNAYIRALKKKYRNLVFSKKSKAVVAQHQGLSAGTQQLGGGRHSARPKGANPYKTKAAAQPDDVVWDPTKAGHLQAWESGQASSPSQARHSEGLAASKAQCAGELATHRHDNQFPTHSNSPAHLNDPDQSQASADEYNFDDVDEHAASADTALALGQAAAVPSISAEDAANMLAAAAGQYDSSAGDYGYEQDDQRSEQQSQQQHPHLPGQLCDQQQQQQQAADQHGIQRTSSFHHPGDVSSISSRSLDLLNGDTASVASHGLASLASHTQWDKSSPGANRPSAKTSGRKSSGSMSVDSQSLTRSTISNRAMSASRASDHAQSSLQRAGCTPPTSATSPLAAVTTPLPGMTQGSEQTTQPRRGSGDLLTHSSDQLLPASQRQRSTGTRNMLAQGSIDGMATKATQSAADGIATQGSANGIATHSSAEGMATQGAAVDMATVATQGAAGDQDRHHALTMDAKQPTNSDNARRAETGNIHVTPNLVSAILAGDQSACTVDSIRSLLLSLCRVFQGDLTGPTDAVAGGATGVGASAGMADDDILEQSQYCCVSGQDLVSYIHEQMMERTVDRDSALWTAQQLLSSSLVVALMNSGDDPNASREFCDDTAIQYTVLTSARAIANALSYFHQDTAHDADNQQPEQQQHHQQQTGMVNMPTHSRAAHHGYAGAGGGDQGDAYYQHDAEHSAQGAAYPQGFHGDDEIVYDYQTGRPYSPPQELSQYADVEPFDGEQFILYQDRVHPFHAACGLGKEAGMLRNLVLMFGIEHCDRQQHTPLMFAILSDKPACITCLLECAAEPTKYDGDGYTALHHATRLGHYRSAATILSKVKHELISTMIDQVDMQGLSVLHWATQLRSDKCLELYLKHSRRGHVNKMDYEHRTPLFWAITEKNDRHVELLLRSDADPIVVDSFERPACQLAIQSQAANCLKVLLRFRSTLVDVLDGNGQTPLHAACQESSVDCFKLIMKAAPGKQWQGINAVDTLGRSPLHCATLANCPDLVQLLLNLKADVWLQDVNGQTARQCANSTGSTPCEALLARAEEALLRNRNKSSSVCALM
eukprot:scpid10003/ scgid12652/ Inversin